MLVLPRSARLAAWGTAVLTGTVDVADAVKVVQSDDEPHGVVHAEPEAGQLAAPASPSTEPIPPGTGGPFGADSPGAANPHGASDDALAGGLDLAHALPPSAGLADLLTVLISAGATQLRLVLPEPGDVLGLPGPPWFNAVAVEAGECVLVDTPPLNGSRQDGGPAAGAWALVPRVTEFGSAWEPGAMVTWELYAVQPARVTVLGGVAEADQELRFALEEATRELARLDVARWRDDAADRLAAIRRGGVDPGLLPPSTPPRCLRVLATAARVRAIVELAGEDDGGAVSGYEAGVRSEALRGLERVSRRAVVAAVNGVLDP